jgi:hypothetical protein
MTSRKRKLNRTALARLLALERISPNPGIVPGGKVLGRGRNEIAPLLSQPERLYY